jgi:hypothetical protein
MSGCRRGTKNVLFHTSNRTNFILLVSAVDSVGLLKVLHVQRSSCAAVANEGQCAVLICPRRRPGANVDGASRALHDDLRLAQPAGRSVHATALSGKPVYKVL